MLFFKLQESQNKVVLIL